MGNPRPPSCHSLPVLQVAILQDTEEFLRFAVNHQREIQENTEFCSDAIALADECALWRSVLGAQLDAGPQSTAVQNSSAALAAAVEDLRKRCDTMMNAWVEATIDIFGPYYSLAEFIDGHTNLPGRTEFSALALEGAARHASDPTATAQLYIKAAQMWLTIHELELARTAAELAVSAGGMPIITCRAWLTLVSIHYAREDLDSARNAVSQAIEIGELSGPEHAEVVEHARQIQRHLKAITKIVEGSLIL